MPTITYTNAGFAALNTGLVCIGLALSTGENSFDLSDIDGVNDPFPCSEIPEEIKARIRAVLDDVVFEIPSFPVRIRTNLGDGTLARFRLNQMAKNTMGVSWSAAYGGSILVTMGFESGGTELLGTFHGQVNDGRLFIYFVSRVNPTGRFTVALQTAFSATINIEGLSNQLEPRKKIREAFAEETKKALEPHAQTMAHLLVASLLEIDSAGTALPTPPESAFYTELDITEGQAVVGWANSVRQARVTVESVDPAFALAEDRLILRLGAGWPGGPLKLVTRTAEPETELGLPLVVSGVSLPDEEPLVVEVEMRFVDLRSSAPKIRAVATISRTYPAPGYGAGPHTESSGELTAEYRIIVV